MPASAVNTINQISIIADFTRGYDTDDRYNSILFVTITLSSLSQENDLKRQFLEIAKAVFRSFPYQCFLIFNVQGKVKYCASIFRPYINKQRNNKVEEIVFSDWINNKNASRKNAEMELSINNLLTTADNARGIYNQIYQKILDVHSYEMKRWKTKSKYLDELIDQDTILIDSDETNECEDDMPAPYKIENSPETEKKLEDYAELQKKAQTDPTGESQYLFAKEHYYGTLHRNLITYRDFLIDAAQKDYPPAIEELASLYESGMKDDRSQPLINKSLEKALSLYKKINNTKKILDIMLKMNAKH